MIYNDFPSYFSDHYISPINAIGSDKTWGSRRMNKQAKYGRFEAQQFLEAEIRAKQQALDELRVARTRCDETEKELFEANRKIRLQKDEMERVERENRKLREKLYSQRSVVDVPDLVDYSNSRANNSSFFNMMSTNGTNDFSMMSSKWENMPKTPQKMICLTFQAISLMFNHLCL